MNLNTLAGLLDISGTDMAGLLDISGVDIAGALLTQGIDGDHSDGDGSYGEMDGSDGDDVLGLFGRKKHKRHGGGNALLRQLILAKKVQQAGMTTQLAAVAERRLSIGFASLNIAANATAPITVQPQWAFKGQRLSIPSAIVNFFDILSVQIGAVNQFPSPGAQPASSFADVAVGDNMEMDTCNLGQLVTLTVQNVDPGAAHSFKASLFGKAIITAPTGK